MAILFFFFYVSICIVNVLVSSFSSIFNQISLHYYISLSYLGLEDLQIGLLQVRINDNGRERRKDYLE